MGGGDDFGTSDMGGGASFGSETGGDMDLGGGMDMGGGMGMGAIGGDMDGEEVDMNNLANPGPAPEPEAPKISASSLSAIAKWRMEHVAMVEEKVRKEQGKQAEMLGNAKADMDGVFAKRLEKKTKRHATNRHAHAQPDPLSATTVCTANRSACGLLPAPNFLIVPLPAI
ncbi:hypothetical protein T492DRAFT_163187 [Pavlovales sp. CCMP2436]|nr:hypothetical protein T492DRAFT_163187 [Pavlovales sp. CCMP2436]